MGCDARIVLLARDRSGAVAAARAAFDRIAEVDAALSDWRVDSEIERLGAELDRSPLPFAVATSPVLTAALRCSMCVRASTSGRFDPALGALTRLWRRHAREGSVPSADEFERARSASGAEHIEVHEGRLVIRVHGLRFDFGGIGKGMAADLALDELRRRNHGTALVQIAGDAAIGDAPPGRAGWRVRIAASGRLVELAPGSGISSSGDREQWIEVDGERRSHILEPSTGVGSRGAPGVTVIVSPRERRSACDACGAAALADALATAATLMNDAERDALVASLPGIEVIVTPSPRAPESPPDPAGATRTTDPPGVACRARATWPDPR